MSWPTPSDYDEGVENLRHSMSDEELRTGQAALDSQQLPYLGRRPADRRPGPQPSALYDWVCAAGGQNASSALCMGLVRHRVPVNHCRLGIPARPDPAQSGLLAESDGQECPSCGQ